MFTAKTVAHKLSKINPDIQVDDGDVIQVGSIKIRVIYTPGHTPDSICLLADDKMLLTGDTLFVGECGRTDLPGGDPKSMYDSLFNKLLKLDDDMTVYPGHDYGPNLTRRLGKKENLIILKPRSLAEFISFMRTP